MKWLRFALPLAIFGGIAVLLASGLGKDTRLVPSPLIDKPAPAYSLPELRDPSTRFSGESLRGQAYVLNVWGSWCVACRVEHPFLQQFADRNIVPVVGLNWKDEPGEATRWLAQFGDPYDHIPVDAEGRTAIDFGVYGAPETFVIDGNGTIRYKHVGPMSPDVIERELMPAIEAAKRTALEATQPRDAAASP